MTVLTDWVVEHIRAALRTRAMVPGATYSGYQLAADLGISRSPVRDGLLRLAATGLIEFTPNRGFRIIQPTETDIAEIYALRIAIEVPAARRAARILASQQGPLVPWGTCTISSSPPSARARGAAFSPNSATSCSPHPKSPATAARTTRPSAEPSPATTVRRPASLCADTWSMPP